MDISPQNGRVIHQMIRHPRVKREGSRLIKFLVVGGVSFSIYFAVYFLMSRFLFPEGNKTLLNFLAICISTIFNFLAHRTWTYEARERSLAQIVRYMFVVGSVAMLQTLLFWIGYEVLHAHDLVVTFIVAGVCAMCSFVSHRYFTFREKRLVAVREERLDEAVL